MKEEEMGLEAEKFVSELKRRGFTVTTVESLTGGMIASTIVSVPGASEVFREGYVTYCDEAKHKLVGVSLDTLRIKTAVSEETAREMAEGGRSRADSSLALSATGIAGPDGGTEEKPVGLVYIGCATKEKTEVRRLLLKGTRMEIRMQTVYEAISLGRAMLAEG